MEIFDQNFLIYLRNDFEPSAWVKKNDCSEIRTLYIFLHFPRPTLTQNNF